MKSILVTRMRNINEKFDFGYKPLPKKRIGKVMRSLKKLWKQPRYKEMRFFQFVEVIGYEYKQENGDCDLWNLYDEVFERWLREQIKTYKQKK